MTGLELFGFCLLAGYYSFLAVLSWEVWCLAKKRRWIGSMVVSSALVLVVVFPGIVWGILPGSSIYLDRVQTRQLVGHSFLLGTPGLSYHTERSFTGDGYSIEVYSISGRAASKLVSPTSDFFKSFPVRPDVRSHWEVGRWRETPSRPEDAEFIEFALVDHKLHGHDSSNPQEIALKLLEQKGNFYSYFYHDPTDYLANVDFFILSPKERVLVIVNFNT